MGIAAYQSRMRGNRLFLVEITAQTDRQIGLETQRDGAQNAALPRVAVILWYGGRT
jgi:hypothetical protein